MVVQCATRFGLAIDAFSTGPQAIDAPVVRPSAIQGDTHEATKLDGDVLDAAFAFADGDGLIRKEHLPLDEGEHLSIAGGNRLTLPLLLEVVLVKTLRNEYHSDGLLLRSGLRSMNTLQWEFHFCQGDVNRTRGNRRGRLTREPFLKYNERRPSESRIEIHRHY